MANNGYAPAECLNEHLDYFNQNIADQNPGAQGGDFDDIFNQDFDLVFDPLMMVANPVPLDNGNHHSQPSHHSHGEEPIPLNVQSSNNCHGNGYSNMFHTSSEPVPVNVPSTTYVPPPQQSSASQSMPVYTKSMITSKLAPAVVSPTSVTSVFTEIPQQQQKPAPVAKSSPRKRSYSMVQTSKPSTTTTSTAASVSSKSDEEPIDTSNMSFQEQEDLRRERNRHHAKRSRQRKRDYMNQLEEAVNEMRKENERLFEILGMDSNRAKYDMAKEEEKKAAVATEKFIAGLKQPRNRVLDNTTLAFLRELWK